MNEMQIAKQAVKALDSKKAQEIKLLKVTDLTVLADYFVIATGTSSTHVRALADEVDHALTEQGLRPSHVEGSRTRDWILLDFGAVVVHVFSAEAREFYALDRLWADAEPMELELEQPVS